MQQEITPQGEYCMPAELLPIECDIIEPEIAPNNKRKLLIALMGALGATTSAQGSGLGGERIDDSPEKVYTITRRPPLPPMPMPQMYSTLLSGNRNRTRQRHNVAKQHKKNKAAKKSRKINRE